MNNNYKIDLVQSDSSIKQNKPLQTCSAVTEFKSPLFLKGLSTKICVNLYVNKLIDTIFLVSYPDLVCLLGGFGWWFDARIK
jgi:hypothetical protein